jgi:uncharacterized repeat protein (TIGR03803 family)
MRHSLTGFAITLSIAFAMTIVSVQEAHAQTYTVLHNFSNGPDGGSPEAMLTRDVAGHLYGTTLLGGSAGYGTVFKVTKDNGSWIFSTIYTFEGDNGNNDGAAPYARVVIGPNGSLYGTTVAGGGGSGCSNFGAAGCGTIFNLQPPFTVCHAVNCPWHETVLYRFANGPGGVYPFGGVTFDTAGNIYGTTELGGIGYDEGTIYKLTPSGGGWSGSVLYSFQGSANSGGNPYDGLILDRSGNLYGSTRTNGTLGSGQGLLFELSNSGSGWVENAIYELAGANGSNPFGGLIFDASGNLYGATSCGGSGNGGTVFQLSPSGGGWDFTLLYSFSGDCQWGPADSLTMDSAGNLYGTTYRDGASGLGSVFKLTHSSGGWTYSDLHDFSGGADGCEPNGGVVVDSQGNIYGTTTGCGQYPNQYGTIWEIMP